MQVSSIRSDGKAKGCRVHDLIRDLILEKFEDLNFCKHISEIGLSSLSGIIRRLSITTMSNDIVACFESSHVQSLLVSKNNISVIHCLKRIPTRYRLLKVLDYQDSYMFYVPDSLGSLIHLKYLKLRLKTVYKLPNSIGMLQILETLDVKGTNVRDLQKEISKLKKLRHLIGNLLSLNQLKEGIGEMKSLQTLRLVSLDMDGAAEVIKALGKLKEIRELGLCGVWTENGSILSSSINEMKHLEKLCVSSDYIEVIDLHLIPAPTMLQKLTLTGRLQKLPELIPKLPSLVVLRLTLSFLDEDPMQSLKNLQHLLYLSIGVHAYIRKCLHFQDGWFLKLKELEIISSYDFRDIVFEKGALPSLKKLKLHKQIPGRTKNIPTGIQLLENLEVLNIRNMENEFVQHNSTEDWN